MDLSTTSNLLNILREIDLGSVQQQARSWFYLVVVGEPDLTRVLAEALSRDGEKTGTHPWLEQRSFAAQDLPKTADVAIVLTSSSATAPRLERILEHFAEVGTATLRLVVSPEAVTEVGAELPHLKEAGRVVMPSLSTEPIARSVLPALLKAVPESLHLALAHHLPPLRPLVSRALIEKTSRANALYSASSGLASVVPILNIPLNVADIVVLTKNQLLMAYKLALVHGKRGDPAEVMGEVVSVVGGGFFFRQAARELVGLIPVWGIVPNVAVSYAGTWVIGKTVELWASKGETLKRSELRSYYRQSLAQGRALAKTLVAATRRQRWARLPWRNPKARLESPEEEPST